jgi:hypothetical protein
VGYGLCTNVRFLGSLSRSFPRSKTLKKLWTGLPNFPSPSALSASLSEVNKHFFRALVFWTSARIRQKSADITTTGQGIFACLRFRGRRQAWMNLNLSGRPFFHIFLGPAALVFPRLVYCRSDIRCCYSFCKMKSKNEGSIRYRSTA